MAVFPTQFMTLENAAYAMGFFIKIVFFNVLIVEGTTAEYAVTKEKPKKMTARSWSVSNVLMRQIRVF